MSEKIEELKKEITNNKDLDRIVYYEDNKLWILKNKKGKWINEPYSEYKERKKRVNPTSEIKYIEDKEDLYADNLSDDFDMRLMSW